MRIKEILPQKSSDRFLVNFPNQLKVLMTKSQSILLWQRDREWKTRILVLISIIDVDGGCKA